MLDAATTVYTYFVGFFPILSQQEALAPAHVDAGKFIEASESCLLRMMRNSRLEQAGAPGL